MTSIRLKYVIEDIDRHGNVRRYVRMPGRSKVRLRSQPGTKQFMEDYGTAIASHTEQPRQAGEAARGSFRHLCIAYFGSAAFTRLDPSTQAWQRRALDLICERHAEKPVALMQPKHVRKLRDELKDKLGAAKSQLKALRSMFRWAVEADEAPLDPTLGVRAIAYATKGFHSWSIDEVHQYEDRHPLGTKARLALALLLYTSWRREDAVRLGPQHVRDGRIKYRQAKNEHRNPVEMDIPLHPDLAEAISTMPSGHMTFLVTEYGKPFTSNGFGNALKDWCRQANLPHCSAHGLRKRRLRAWPSAARRLTRSWRSPATGRSRRSNGTRAQRGRRASRISAMAKLRSKA